MKYTAVIKANGNVEKIYKCFLSEIKKEDRSEVKIEKYKDYVEFKVSATDSVALRASLNSITKLLTVYEKIEALK